MRPVPDAENTGVQFPEAPEWQPPQRTARAPLVRQAVFSAENNMTQAQRDAQGWRWEAELRRGGEPS